MPTAARRTEDAIPRMTTRRCSGGCGCTRPALNGAWYRRLRVDAKVTLKEMAEICEVSVAYLSRMERGRLEFLPEYAAFYDRLFERRRRAGEPS